MANPCLPNIRELIQAGINPKTGLPNKFGNCNKEDLKINIKKFLRVIDEQDAVNRGTWYNLPCNISSQELERLLYYKGQLAFFYIEELDEFYFMPYALDGTIDFYGRFNTIHPVPMANGTTDNEKAASKNQRDYLSTLKLNCVYGVVDPEKVDDKMMTKSCVLLHDYTKQLSQTIIPRQEIQEPILDVMAEMIPFMRTNLLANSGVEGIRVNDADQAEAVEVANRSLEASAVMGKPYTPIIGAVEFQELTGGNAAKSEEFMIAMQSLDNLRLSSYGLDNGGLFEKKAHILNSEQEVNQTNVGLVFQDGVSIRQNFCNIVNSIWDLGIWYEPTQNETMADTDGDGVLYDRKENTNDQGVENNGTNDTNV